MINTKRIKTLRTAPPKNGLVVYWMERDMRVNDNWALVYAQLVAIEQRLPLLVLYCLSPDFIERTERAYQFVLNGLKETEHTLRKKNIPFMLLNGSPGTEIPKFVKMHDVSAVVTDFNPLAAVVRSKQSVAEKINAAMYVVDAHNIVPAWLASDKREFGAYTLRPKIHRHLPEFLEDFPPVQKHPFLWKQPVEPIDWEAVHKKLKFSATVNAVDWILPGETEGNRMMSDFLKRRLESYDRTRNNPVADGQSNLSPYLHCGHIAPQRIALEAMRENGIGIDAVARSKKNDPAATRSNVEAFLEELIVRRELADNFVYYNANYTSFDGFPAWARQSLNEHRKDKRDFLYTLKQFEQAETHDPLWNAAQMQVVKRGKMHGYMRMYWAKKILEWTSSPEEAMMIAIHLNDTYELDGRDPNGYAGIAWSIGGVHDRAWFDRPVFGKVRYMNYRGSESKFNVKEYIRQQNTL